MKNNKTTIRLAGPEDAVLLANLSRQTFIEAFGKANTPDNLAAYLEGAFSPGTQFAELSSPGSLFLLLEQEQSPIGYARLLESAAPTCITGVRPIELVRFYLRGAYIGQGLGSLLMQACLDTAQGRGQDVIWLGVWQKNDHAIRFYTRWGFQKVGTHPFQLGSDLQVDDLMQRTLTGERVDKGKD